MDASPQSGLRYDQAIESVQQVIPKFEECVVPGIGHRFLCLGPDSFIGI